MKNKAVWIVVIFGIAFAAIIWNSTRNLAMFRVEVCIDYQGRSACRTASAATRENALRTATDNACAQIASGMTDSIACTNTAPTSVRWLDRK